MKIGKSHKYLYAGILGGLFLLVRFTYYYILHAERQEIAPTRPHAQEWSIAQNNRIIAERKRFQLIQEGLKLAFLTKIEFYGKVLDQDGHGVPFANVRYTVSDKFMAPGTGGHTTADQDGYYFFESRGALVMVSVNKDGYLSYEEYGRSRQMYAFGFGVDSSSKPPPTASSPALLYLHNLGETEPLYHVTGVVRIPKNGDLVKVNLLTGRKDDTNGNFHIQAWTNDPEGPKKSFDWRCRIAVPHGGIWETDDKFLFTAPESGYIGELTFQQSAKDKSWKSKLTTIYFLRFFDNTYARIVFNFTARGSHYISYDIYLNPQPGSRKLGFDPSKRISLEIRPR